MFARYFGSRPNENREKFLRNHTTWNDPAAFGACHTHNVYRLKQLACHVEFLGVSPIMLVRDNVPH